VTATSAIDEIEAIFDRYHASGAAPGCAFGIAIDGELVHSGGRGTIRAAGSDGSAASGVPDADSVFRIASMTKSFTAATILRLRDDGVLGLDDEVATWVPELANLAPWSSDSPPITIRSLLTMSAGLPTDDPWGDRQQAMADDAFLAFLRGGPLLAWPAGTRYEYANLGFAILGTVVERASGEPYRAAVEKRFLEPLRLAGTGYDESHVEPSRIAPGHARRGDDWIEQPMAGHGAFAPMGGLFSTVRDLATWATWFAGAFPARDDPDDARPLSRATRREMQQLHRAMPPELHWTSAARPPEAEVSGYGYGLFVNLDVKRGRIVGHGGGYPGYGSSMVWHPATGIAVVGVANGRYARMGNPCREALNLLIDREAAPAHRPVPWPQVVAARAAVDDLIETWDEAVATRLFAMNVELDEDLASRRAAIENLRAVHGRLRPDPTEPASSWSPADVAWWLAGDRGRVKVEILLDAERPPLVQSLEITSVPEPPARLTAIAERIVAVLASASPVWPDDLALGAAVDRAAVERELRATEAVFGPIALGPVTSSDGQREASWRLRGGGGDVTLALELAADQATIAKVSLVPVTLESPVHLA
jgi:CubicO group peptidase (beta-lactamase class C family)